MAYENPPKNEHAPHPERNPGEMPDHAPEAAPVITPEQEAERQAGIEKAKESLREHGKESADNHEKKDGTHGGEKKHEDHGANAGHGHGKKPGFFENVGKTMKRNKGAAIIVGSGTIGSAALALPAAAWAGGYGMSFIGQHAAAAGFQWGSGLAHAGSELVGVSSALAPYLLPVGLVGVGVAAACIWGPMFWANIVDRIADYATGTKPAKGSGGGGAAAHGGGHGGGHGH